MNSYLQKQEKEKNVRKMLLLMAIVALIGWMPRQVLANTCFDSTFDSTLGTVTSSTPGFNNSLTSYGTVHVVLNDQGNIAKITITPLKSSDFGFVSGSSWNHLTYSAFLNVNAATDSFETTSGWWWTSRKGTYSPDGLGTFNLAAANQGWNSESVAITLTRNSGSWADASQVLIANAAGFDAGVWLTAENGCCWCKSTGYVGEDAAPLPGGLLLLGAGLVRLVVYQRRKLV